MYDDESHKITLVFILLNACTLTSTFELGIDRFNLEWIFHSSHPSRIASNTGDDVKFHNFIKIYPFLTLQKYHVRTCSIRNSHW